MKLCKKCQIAYKDWKSQNITIDALAPFLCDKCLYDDNNQDIVDEAWYWFN